MTHEAALPLHCKMRNPSRYASDADCQACGEGEGDVCAMYEGQSQASLAERRARFEANLLDPKLSCPFAVGAAPMTAHEKALEAARADARWLAEGPLTEGQVNDLVDKSVASYLAALPADDLVERLGRAALAKMEG